MPLSTDPEAREKLKRSTTEGFEHIFKAYDEGRHADALRIAHTLRHGFTILGISIIDAMTDPAQIMQALIQGLKDEQEDRREIAQATAQIRAKG